MFIQIDRCIYIYTYIYIKINNTVTTTATTATTITTSINDQKWHPHDFHKRSKSPKCFKYDPKCIYIYICHLL